jgi:hypothetical protein
MRIFPALAALMLSGCVLPPLEPRVVLDQRTGASLTVVDQPLVFARERRDVAVQARDYITLVAAEINESGRRRLVWVAHHWSTIDARATDYRPTPGGPLVLMADGRDLRLLPVSDAAAEGLAKNPALLSPDDANVITAIYAVDAPTLEYVATSKTLSATIPDSGLALPFAIWTDGRPAVMRFLTQTGYLK